MNSELALRFNISVQIVSKWRNRYFFEDTFIKLLNIKYSLFNIEQVLSCSLRRSFWMTLVEILEMCLAEKLKISRGPNHNLYHKTKFNFEV
jgi:hypothetical protein